MWTTTPACGARSSLRSSDVAGAADLAVERSSTWRRASARLSPISTRRCWSQGLDVRLGAGDAPRWRRRPCRAARRARPRARRWCGRSRSSFWRGVAPFSTSVWRSARAPRSSWRAGARRTRAWASLATTWARELVDLRAAARRPGRRARAAGRRRARSGRRSGRRGLGACRGAVAGSSAAAPASSASSRQMSKVEARARRPASWASCARDLGRVEEGDDLALRRRGRRP